MLDQDEAAMSEGEGAEETTERELQVRVRVRDGARIRDRVEGLMISL